MSAPVVEPSACTWCGIARRGHAQQFADAVGWHKWAQPSQEQILARMKARRLASTVARVGALPVPVPVGPEPQAVDAGPVVKPLALHEAQIDALVAAGNRVVNDETHEHLCMCDGWPEKCVSTGNYFMGAWDVDGLEAALPAVLGLWEQMRGGELLALKARVAELEAERRSAGDGSGGCTCPPSDRPEPHRVDCPEVDAPSPVDGPLPGVDAPEMRALRSALYGVPDGEFYGLVHHDYRVSHDLPETGGTQ